ncbi:MAG: 16S rRNA (guanine(527)-N(7))-methyltransferase RsmG [Caldilineaceae bacterium]|nr:16S rRNA (guanine(527)-N(7))-methyltransferase RsmG [Caldilineaceae bacterium]
MDLLVRGCNQLGIVLSEKQIGQFSLYFDLLAEWNQKMNLTAIDDLAGVQTKHFLDSLVGLPLIQEEMGEGKATPQWAIDVGSGAGFPGLPLKIACPDMKLVLLDGTGKKVRFLEEVVAALKLSQVEVVQGRAEEVGHNERYRGKFDLVVARAVARLNTLVEYLIPFARQGGFVVTYKGPGAAEEFMEARKAIDLLGGEVARFAPVQVPLLEEERRILLIKKQRRTPAQYPRGQGLPRKSPLG